MFKDLRLLVRDRGALFLTFAWPLVLATFFGALSPGFGVKPEGESQSGSGTMTVLVVDDDRSEASEALISELDGDPRVTLEPASLDAARERVRSGEHPAYVHVSAGFGATPSRLLDPSAPAPATRPASLATLLRARPPGPPSALTPCRTGA